MISDCVKNRGCPKGQDLRECKYFPKECPFVTCRGSDLIIGDKQQELFKE